MTEHAVHGFVGAFDAAFRVDDHDAFRRCDDTTAAHCISL